MTKEKYNIEITEKNNIYEFCNSKYEVFHKSNNLEKGFNEIKEKIEDKIKFFNENQITIKSNKNNNLKDTYGLNYKNLIIKNFIRTFFSILSFLVIIIIIFSLTINLVKKNEIKGGRQFWKNFENELEKLSNKEIDTSSQDKIISSIRKIGEKYKPFLDEIKIIFD